MAKQEHTIDWLLKNYLPFFKRYNIDEHYIRNGYERWKVGKKTAFVPDYLWSLFNQLINEAGIQATSEEQMYRNLRDIYLEMAMFQRKHEKKKAHQVMIQHHFANIRCSSAQSNLELEVVIMANGCCPYCASYDQKRMTIEEALQNLPICSEQCTRETGCNCGTALSPKRDQFGRVLRKPKY